MRRINHYSTLYCLLEKLTYCDKLLDLLMFQSIIPCCLLLINFNELFLYNYELLMFKNYQKFENKSAAIKYS